MCLRHVFRLRGCYRRMKVSWLLNLDTKGSGLVPMTYPSDPQMAFVDIQRRVLEFVFHATGVLNSNQLDPLDCADRIAIDASKLAQNAELRPWMQVFMTTMSSWIVAAKDVLAHERNGSALEELAAEADTCCPDVFDPSLSIYSAELLLATGDRVGAGRVFNRLLQSPRMNYDWVARRVIWTLNGPCYDSDVAGPLEVRALENAVDACRYLLPEVEPKKLETYLRKLIRDRQR